MPQTSTCGWARWTSHLPFPEASFDLCLSNFAIYNAADPAFTLRELKRVMAPGAELVLISGPTLNNAREIYDFNERLTGQAIDPITLVRMNGCGRISFRWSAKCSVTRARR